MIYDEFNVYLNDNDLIALYRKYTQLLKEDPNKILELELINIQRELKRRGLAIPTIL